MSAEFTHWGTPVAAALRTAGVETVFTLSGGHIFPIFDGCVRNDIRLVDVRHEATAAFAAEGWARLSRRPGVAAVTAGPGVFNVVSVLATAQQNRSPLVVLGGRAPESRWGMGSLQEIDHIPVAASLTKRAETAVAKVGAQLQEGIVEAMTPPRGPVFFDFPLDLAADYGAVDDAIDAPKRLEPDSSALTSIAGAVAKASRPMMICGSGVYADDASEAMQSFAEVAKMPVFTNGLGRGTIPADHELAFSRTRSKAMEEADVVIVAGTPFDFRLSFGDRFNREAKVYHLESAPELLTSNRTLEAGIGADLQLVFKSLADTAKPADNADWLQTLRDAEELADAESGTELASEATPIHPMRIYGELIKAMDRDAIVVGDGGDFVSYAGKEIPSYVPGAWLDPGPFGCLGCGPGYAIASRLLNPDRQIVLLLGDGAFGFSGLEFDTMVRHGLPVVGVMGNNGAWGLEKHPMRTWFGYDVAAELNQDTRYDKVVEALGGYGETVSEPGEIAPALKRAFESGVPSLVNILTDPEVAYPRSANLA